MAKLDNISNIEIDNKARVPVQNKNKKTSVNQWNISCEHFRYKRCILVFVCIILITIIVTVPTVVVQKRKMTINPTTTTTTTTTIEVPLNIILSSTTKWKQNGITIFHPSYSDQLDLNVNAIDIDDDQTIYISEPIINRVIELKLNRTNISVVAGGNEDGDGTHQLSRPVDVIVDKKNDSILICDGFNSRIVRWSRQNAINGEIILSNIHCHGLSMDDKGYLYVSDWINREVRRWDIRFKNQSILVAGANGMGNDPEQFFLPTLIFVDKDYSVYVTDYSNHRILKWIKDATLGIVVAGGNGNGDKLTQLSGPLGIAVDHLGNVYIADTNNHRVMRWINGAKEGTIVVGGNGPGRETNQLYSPSDLLFDKYGNLYVFDAANYRLQKFLIESN